MDEATTTTALPMLPLPGGVVAPGMVVTIALDSGSARGAVSAAEAVGDRVLLVPKTPEGYAAVGTIARVEQHDRLRGGRRGILVRGLSRARIGAATLGSGDATWVTVEAIDDSPPVDQAEAIQSLADDYRAVVEAILERRGGSSIAAAIAEITNPGQLADTAVYSPDLDVAKKVQVLETVDVMERLELVLGWARETLAELEVRQKIRDDVSSSMEKRQREFILREQLKAIRTELRDLGGSGAAEDEDPVDRYRSKLAEAAVPEDVRAKISEEIDRLERTSEQSPEQSWIRTWLDRVLALPWDERTADTTDLVHARSVLDADHTGVEEVKDRLIEQLAVRKLKEARERVFLTTSEETDSAETPQTDQPAPRGRRGAGAILALVGPPGVGKTSLGESVARALGRRFVRVALGGVRDEAEIRGHRRTYVGAQPGRIARAIADAGTMNPVILLDEIDKVGAGWQGDPSAALLEVLDPAQNHTFRDHYLELDLDLSDVLFIATANVLESIPGPLLDRLEVIRLDGYTDAEKVAIARDHLLLRQLTAAGLETSEVEISDEGLAQIVEGWTQEAGVRQLERQIAKLLRKVAVDIAGGTQTPIVIDDLEPRLGRQRVHRSDNADRVDVPGVSTGLAVTGTGGDVLFIEAARIPGEAGLELTGQLGDVMKESAHIARSFLRANAEELGLDSDRLADDRFHLHVPAGAIPKDGPSAGTAMTTALASLVSGRKVRTGVGMTGEVTLQGRVLPIGGVKQKVLAAHRAGLDTVLLPLRNGPDVEDVPDEVREQMTIHLVSDVREVLTLALMPT